MTTPGALPPEGAYQNGDEYGTDLTEETARALVTQPYHNSYGGLPAAFMTGIGSFIGRALDGNPENDPTIGEVADYFIGWNRINAANASKIAQLENRLASGSTFMDDFARPNNLNALGNGWVQGGQGQGLGVYDNAARIDNTEIIGIDSGRRWAICPVMAAEDNVAVTAVVNPKGVAVPTMTSLFIRADENLTKFVYANVYGRSVYMGYGTRNGNTWVFNDWKSNTNYRLSEGSSVELAADSNVYRLTIDGVVVLEHTDTAGAVPVDATRRTVGFASETKIVNLLPSYSWGLAAFSHRPITFADMDGLRKAAEDALKAAEDAQGTVEGVQAAFAEYVAGQEAASNEGAFFIEDFSKLDDQPDMGPNWTVSQTGNVAIKGGAVGYQVAGESSATRAVFAQKPTNDDHYARALIATSTWDDTYTGLIVRGNDSMSQYVFARFYKGKIEIGTGTTGYVETVQYTKTGLSITAGSMVELRAVGNTYYVLVNSAVRGQVTLSALFGPNYRRTGMMLSRHQGAFWISYVTHVRMFITGDYAAPAFVGTGWSFWRLNNAADQSSGTTSGDKVFGDTVFDQVGPETRNVKRINDGAGIVEIEVPGWYQIDGRMKSDYSLTSDGSTSGTTLQAHINFINDETQPTYIIARAGGSVEGASMAEVSGLVYLQKGNRVRMGFYRSSGNMDPIGAPLGAATRFSGTLITSLKGARGETGAQGDVGPQGPIGEGLHFDLLVNTVAALPVSAVELTQALVKENGRIYLFKDGAWIEGPVLTGPKGDEGPSGPPNSLIVGSVTTGAEGSNASVSITGSAPMQVLNMTIPRGATGPTGPQPPLQKVTTLPATGVVGTIYWIEE
ncbi:putative tail protein [Rhodococcus phage RGL3]|uniref:Putative tail protein n=1 Tax=Rhodococcus phage RGL3 TaxID=2922221 RepID=G9FHL2_9CAUD|nr:tail protein [Rhodococcus phage RGL3]AEV52100.1 putative tail protein [Rhodococcus phage RGL3]